jgi:signal transduction histidine kinase
MHTPRTHHPYAAEKWAVLRQAIPDALCRAPGEPPRTVLPRRRWLRWPLLFLLTVLSLGWTAGAIAIPLNVFDPLPPPVIPWLIGPLQAAPLLLAARRPLVAWRISAAGLLLGAVLLQDRYFWPWPVTAWLAFVLILFLVGVGHGKSTNTAVGLLTLLGLLVPGVVIGGMPGWFGLILAGIVLIALAFGDALGGRYAAELSLAEQEALRLQTLAEQARLEERARIARELHDVVAHHMSVIAMQAEAAPYKIPDLPPAAADTFTIVRDAARDALAETRRVVGLLRSADEGAEKRPQPGLDLLEELAGAARQAGLTVDLTIVGVPRPLPAGLDLSAYRIVQESLSNAARYAPGAKVGVEIRYQRQELVVRVSDDGPHGTPQEPGGGHGLVGMRERATMLGGTLHAGPDGPAGGWLIEGVLPYGEESAP